MSLTQFDTKGGDNNPASLILIMLFLFTFCFLFVSAALTDEVGPFWLWIIFLSILIFLWSKNAKRNAFNVHIIDSGNGNISIALKGPAKSKFFPDVKSYEYWYEIEQVKRTMRPVIMRYVKFTMDDNENLVFKQPGYKENVKEEPRNWPRKNKENKWEAALTLAGVDDMVKAMKTNNLAGHLTVSRLDEMVEFMLQIKTSSNKIQDS